MCSVFISLHKLVYFCSAEMHVKTNPMCNNYDSRPSNDGEKKVGPYVIPKRSLFDPIHWIKIESPYGSAGEPTSMKPTLTAALLLSLLHRPQGNTYFTVPYKPETKLRCAVTWCALCNIRRSYTTSHRVRFLDNTHTANSRFWHCTT